MTSWCLPASRSKASEDLTLLFRFRPKTRRPLSPVTPPAQRLLMKGPQWFYSDWAELRAGSGSCPQLQGWPGPVTEAPGAGDGHGSQELRKGWGSVWQAEVGVCEEVQVGRCRQAETSGLTQRLRSGVGGGRDRAGPAACSAGLTLEPWKRWKWARGPNNEEGPAAPVPGHIIM